MSTKTKAEPKPKVDTEAQSTTEEVMNDPVLVEAFGRKYQIRRFNVGQLLRAAPYLSPLSYVLISAVENKVDTGTLVARILATAGEPVVGLVSVAISEPAEWIEEQDDSIGALELLTATVEKNARYFFDSANAERIKAAFARLQSITQTHGGAISIP